MRKVLILALLALAAPAARAAAEAEADLSRPDATAPTPVRVGLYLVNLHDIIGAEQTFLADVMMKAEWRDPRLAGKGSEVRSLPLDEIWNPRLQLANQRSVSTALPRRVEVDSSGRVTYRQLFTGRFTAPMSFTDFPRDRHRLGVQLVTLGYSPTEIALLYEGKDSQSGRAADLSLTDWDVGPVRVKRADFLPGPGERPLAGVALSWEVRRHLAYLAMQVILPLVLIVLMGWTALWPAPTVVPARISIAVTTMLTLIAYRFALARSLPNLAYLTRMDYFIVGSTLLVFLIIVLVTLSSRFLSQGRQPLVERLDRWAIIGYPVLFVVVCALSWWG